MDRISLKRPEAATKHKRGESAELASEVEIPWQSGMVPGGGRAAITGCKRRRAVEPFADVKLPQAEPIAAEYRDQFLAAAGPILEELERYKTSPSVKLALADSD